MEEGGGGRGEREGGRGSPWPYHPTCLTNHSAHHDHTSDGLKFLLDPRARGEASQFSSVQSVRLACKPRGRRTEHLGAEQGIHYWLRMQNLQAQRDE